MFNFVAFKLKNEKATDVIRSAFYANARNDSAFECSFLFDQFMVCITEKSHVLIVNPSPDFLLKCLSDACLSRALELHFTVPDETVAACYNGQFSCKSFLAYNKMSKLKGLDRILIMSRDQPVTKLQGLLCVLTACNDSALILAILPNAAFESERSIAANMDHIMGVSIDRLVLLPTKITHSSPRKKVLLYMRKMNGEEPLDTIPFYEAFCDDDGYSFYIRKEHWDVSKCMFYTTKRTVLSLKEAAENAKNATEGDKASRNPASYYYFSKEIQLYYIILTNRKNRFAGKAYYCKMLNSATKKRRHGKRITDIIEKGLRAETEHEVFERLENVPFDERVAPHSVTDICSAYAANMDNVSLKTLWFCCRDELLKNSKYDEKIAKQLFCSEVQELADLYPSKAYDSDICKAMELLSDCGAQDIPLKYWRQVDLIIETAMRKKYLHFNPIAELIRRLSSQETG